MVSSLPFFSVLELCTILARFDLGILGEERWSLLGWRGGGGLEKLFWRLILYRRIGLSKVEKGTCASDARDMYYIHCIMWNLLGLI